MLFAWRKRQVTVSHDDLHAVVNQISLDLPYRPTIECQTLTDFHSSLQVRHFDSTSGTLSHQRQTEIDSSQSALTRPDFRQRPKSREVRVAKGDTKSMPRWNGVTGSAQDNLMMIRTKRICQDSAGDQRGSATFADIREPGHD